MGACGSRTMPSNHAGLKPNGMVHRAIESKLLAEFEREKRIIKCLILGAGECGKSTILKQLRILHKIDFTPKEMDMYRKLIRANTLEAIQSLIEALATLGTELKSPELQERAKNLMQYDSKKEFPLSIRDDIEAVWADADIKAVSKRTNEFQFLDSGPFFLDNVRITFDEEYVAQKEHIVRSRKATTGIIQTDFTKDQLHFKLYDVGGQRGERSKWIQCFQHVTAILYIASLSEYDQVLAEDPSRNRLAESLNLFEGIINLPWFDAAPVILFLNKNDLFTEKIKTVDLGRYCEDYSDGCNYQAGLKYIRDQYFARNGNEMKTIYCHITDATDTNVIKFVWKSTKHIILEQNLTQSGLLLA